MYQRRNYSANEMISCGFQAPAKLAEAINLAAELNKATSKASYLQQLVAERVASDLNVPVESILPPEVPPAAQQEAAIAVARLEQTIADAQLALQQMRKQAAPRRHQSGMQRRAS